MLTAWRSKSPTHTRFLFPDMLPTFQLHKFKSITINISWDHHCRPTQVYQKMNQRRKHDTCIRVYIHIRNNLWSKVIILFGKPRLSEACQPHTMQYKSSANTIKLIMKKTSTTTDNFCSNHATFFDAVFFKEI